MFLHLIVFFIQGVKFKKEHFTTLKKNLNLFINGNEKELSSLKRVYPQYSIMKLTDMYYWQIGYDRDTLKSIKKSY